MIAVVEHPPSALRPRPGPTEPEPPPKQKDVLAETWTDPQGFRGWFGTVQNGPIVNRLMTTIFGFFLLGGLEALAMRTQLARPENTVLTADRSNQLFTMHGSMMVFLFAVPMVEAFAEFPPPGSSESSRPPASAAAPRSSGSAPPPRWGPAALPARATRRTPPPRTFAARSSGPPPPPAPASAPAAAPQPRPAAVSA